MFLDKQAFFSGLSQFPVEKVDLGEAGHVFVRTMTAADRDRLEAGFRDKADDRFRARLLAATVCDESGALVFGEGDVPRLAALPCTTVEPIAQAALKLNSLTGDAVEASRKNSESARP